jgi:putative membrane protein
MRRRRQRENLHGASPSEQGKRHDDKENIMRKYTLIKSILFASGFTLVSALYAQAPGSSSPKAAAESPDAAFVQQAARGGLAEVALSKLAVDSANSPQVTQFARKMVADHSANNRQLATIAAHENILVPTEMDSEHTQLRDRLAALHGADFDRGYVDAMRGDHKKMADLLQSSQATVSTEELRTFIKQTLPVVQDHLRMANELKVE